MGFRLLPFFSLLAFASCTNYISALKDGRFENNVALREMSYDVDELKDTLHQTRLDILALEDRIQSQENELLTLRQETKASSHTSADFAALGKKIEELQRMQTNTISDLRSLNTHSQKTTTSLSSYREKIQEIEKKIAAQDRRLNEVVKLKQTLTSIAQAMKNPQAITHTTLYKVEFGDTLGKIAMQHRTTVRKIKELNNLSSNQIYAGQKLKIP